MSNRWYCVFVKVKPAQFIYKQCTRLDGDAVSVESGPAVGAMRAPSIYIDDSAPAIRARAMQSHRRK